VGSGSVLKYVRARRIGLNSSGSGRADTTPTARYISISVHAPLSQAGPGSARCEASVNRNETATG
jgi:hypothetical protein